ncbi:GNAT family N-acetyltransferase [Vibrio quintilis]
MHLQVAWVYVDRSARRKGVATKLLSRLKNISSSPLYISQ